MKKVFSDYFLGLDIGTDSVGWAVTNPDYDLLKFNGKPMWGIRLFESGKSSADRRLQRTARRRRARQVERIKLLEELFAEEITKTDIGFFQRLKDSKFVVEDKIDKQVNSIFNDRNYTDKNYHNEYPTIYHLRRDLLSGKDIKDIRLLYLAILHIIKNRGHFLYDGDIFDSNDDFEKIINNFCSIIEEELSISVTDIDETALKELLKSKSNVTEKKKKLNELFDCKDKRIETINTLIAGGTVNLGKIFEDDTIIDALKENNLGSVSFSIGFDDKYDELSNILEDKMYIVDCVKSLYDWGILSNILNGEKYLSFAKVKIYEKHKSDLKLLKEMVRKYIPKEYYSIFNDTTLEKNYAAYIGMNKKNGKKQPLNKGKCSQADLCSELIKKFSKVEANDKKLNIMLEELKNATLLPKQVSVENSVIPYQLNSIELEKILSNASKSFSFLNEKDEKGISIKQKIMLLLTFKIPYYVGPVNDAHKGKGANCWIVRKEHGKVTPWNFNDKVDTEKSAEAFVLRMTNKCTYLVGEDVVPKCSIIYSKFMVLNELNNIQINGEKLSVELKQKIYETLFLNKKRVKLKDVKNYLKSEGIFDDKTDAISGIDEDFKASMTSYIELSDILGSEYSQDKAEDIIKYITLFGDDKKLLKRKLLQYSSNEKVKRLLALKYKDWGRLSKKFLTVIPDADIKTGEIRYFSIIDALYNSNENLMQLLSEKHSFSKIIKEHNESMGEITAFSYDSLVKDLYVSPGTKRGIWQTLSIMKEIEKVTGHAPKKIFVEMAREHQKDKKRTVSRKNELIDLYKNCKDVSNWEQLFDELNATQEEKLRGDKLYLYYTQMGKCMYSGETIDISQLFNNNVYDIDHIYPQSKVKDDSIENRVLVKRQNNEEKKDNYPLPYAIQTSMMSYWKMLLDKKLIGKVKFDRLTRKTGFTDDELAGFINKQLVETRQSTKAVAETLAKVYPKTDVVYVKAGNVADFKRDNDLIKVREINDLHHAKDAYCNIVVGNVYDAKFTKSPINFIKDKNHDKYSMRKMFDYDVVRNGAIAWIAGENGTIKKVKDTYNKNNILCTRYSKEEKGAFFDIKPMKKGKGQYPLKTSDERMLDIDKYGGYNKVSGAYWALVRHIEKGKTVTSIEYVPVYLSKKIEKNPQELQNYFENTIQLENPQILIPKIKINTLFCIDGFYMNLTGRTGNSLVFRNAMQLVLDVNNYSYAKRVLKYTAYRQEKKSNIEPNVFDKEITENSNKELLEILKEKAITAYKSRFEKLGKNLDVGKFINLSLAEQCEVIRKLFVVFSNDARFEDLSLVGGDKTAGRIIISKYIDKIENISVVNQSITGLFATYKDLKKL